MTDKDTNNPLVGLPGSENPDAPQTVEPAARAHDPNAPPTHFAIDARTVAELRKFLGKQPYDDVGILIRGVESGVPLQLAENPNP